MKKTIQRLSILLAPYKRSVALTAVLLLLLTAIDMALPAIIRQVIDVGLKQAGSLWLLGAGILLAVLGLLKALLSFRQRFTAEWVANNFAYDLRNRLYDHIQRLSFTFHDHEQSGQLISRCIEDVRSIQNFTGHGVIEFLRILVLTVGISAVMFATNARLAFISLLPIIPLVFVTTNYGKTLGRYFLKVDNSLGDLSACLQENVTGVQVVRAFAREEHEIERFNQKNRTLYNDQIRVVKTWGKILPTTPLLIAVGTVLILWFGGQMVLDQQITLGELVQFSSYMTLLAAPAQQLAWLVNAAGEASAGLQRTFEILERPSAIQSPPNPAPLPALRGKVEFDSVSFQYAGENSPALHNIQLTVEPNQVVALIGLTGSGKTSLINLIPRFYDVSSGAVRIDGHDVRSLDLAALRRQIGIVLQTSLLFSVSVRDNLAYGRPNATEEEIIAAARAAQAHDFILQLPKGYDTIVGERGVTLSGGQRQRIAIGRALLLNPRILILDDSTSSVDTQTEHLIQQALGNLMQGRTTFIIAQRLSSVRRADMILVLDQGRIIERGTHDELIRHKGLYREIYELQLRDQEEFQEELTAAEFEPERAARVQELE